MRVAIGADHGGVALKEAVRDHLRANGHDVEDLGTFGTDSVDYPAIALAVARSVAAGGADAGILVCGTGIGMAIVANKVPGIRAANVTAPKFAALARQHNDANVLALAGRFTPESLALEIVDVFLGTAFEGGRHSRRVAQIAESESPTYTAEDRRPA